MDFVTAVAKMATDLDEESFSNGVARNYVKACVHALWSATEIRETFEARYFTNDSVEVRFDQAVREWAARGFSGRNITALVLMFGYPEPLNRLLGFLTEALSANEVQKKRSKREVLDAVVFRVFSAAVPDVP